MSKKLLICADFHHSGAARGQVLLLHWRLGHDLYFPGMDFVRWASKDTAIGVWLSCLPSWLVGLGGVPNDILEPNGEWKYLCSSREQFLETSWDAVLVTRPETQKTFRLLLADHPKKDIKVIAMTGNDCTAFDWDFVRNFMCCDYLSYLNAPKDVNKIYYSQELGTQYGKAFVPIEGRALKTVNSFVNCWQTFTAPWAWDCELSGNGGKCPHCGSRTPEPRPVNIIPYGIWSEVRKRLEPEYTFGEYGIECDLGCVPEVQLPMEYAKGAVTVHLKTYDGYGYSLLQSVACGRPVIVPRGFYRYRTAGKYLIPNLTCFEVDWTADSVIEAIRYVTDNLERANQYARACYTAAEGLFLWGHEAFRVKEFLEKLQ